MGGASKLLSSLLLTSSPLRLRPATAAAALFLSPPCGASRRMLLLSSRSPLRTLSTSSAAAASSSFPPASSSASPAPPPRAPLPEWSRLVDRLAAAGYASRATSLGDELALASGCDLSDGAEAAVSTCLAFARDRPDLLRSLPMKDVEVLVANASPVLFKDGESSAQRLQRYLAGEETYVIVSERAETIDIIRYLLSYTYSSSDSFSDAKELIDSAVRNIMAELVSFTAESTSKPSSLSQHERFSRPPGQNIEMKRGDWICTRCSFMNFARNVRCLECNEQRPKKLLTGGEWECPQCDFYNYGRNMSCLKCDCKRPTTIPPPPSSAGAGLGGVAQLLNATDGGKSEIDRKLAENDEKAERWLSKVSQLDDSADLSSLAEDEDFPEIMPMRKGVNKFVVSTRKTPLERRLANAQYSNNNPQAASSDPKISQTLDRILGRAKPTAASNNQPGTGDALKKSTDHLSSIDPVSFVPLPANMFAKPESNNGQGNLDGQINAEVDSSMENSTAPFPERQNGTESSDTAEKWSKKVAELDVNDVPSVTSDEYVPEIMPMRKGENRFVVSKKKDRSLTSPQYKRRSLLEHADNSDFVPFVPFPPDYFAKKDKPVESSAATGIVSEGSPASKTRLETNASSGKYGSSLNTSQVAGTQPKGNMDNVNWNKNYSQQNWNSGSYGQSNNYQHHSQSQGAGAQSRRCDTANAGTWNTGYSHGNFKESKGDSTYNGANSAQQPYNSGYNNNSNSWSSEISNSNTTWTGNSNYNNDSDWSGNNHYNNNNAWSSNTSYSNSSTWNGNGSYDNNTWSSSHGYNNNATWSNSSHSAWSSSDNNNQSGSFAENSNAASISSGSMNPNQTIHNTGYGGSSNRDYTGKSLEGSAVKDPDPLDMSEEAKAERWFRRAAQIKDISELAIIPDEDFPEIMPMRKGVNRFVVSKRKTPLERRLTSPQYRRNLPIVSSEPEKDAS